MAYLFLLGTPMAIWHFMNKAKEFPVAPLISETPKQPIEIERQLAIVAESFSAFSKDSNKTKLQSFIDYFSSFFIESTKTSQQLFIDYFKALIPMLSNVLNQYNTENTTEISVEYMDLLLKADHGMGQYIAYKKQYNSQFDDVLNAAKSLISQVKVYIDNTSSPCTDSDMLLCLWKLNFSANIVLAYFVLSQTAVDKAAIGMVNSDKEVPKECVELLVDINTLVHKVLAKFTIKWQKCALSITHNKIESSIWIRT
ncbi:hypothetical protein H4219_006028 [Mycoemilia scoparia]|uniref:Uncharacterized protein n=1 Tax=Mycoemilia scoparia TaxID=417184 RepID=A0A9W7ZLK5_9FUNG|nr:hypothetical protein H4219_006028 [Mycoemilia scoparia]